MCLRSTLDIGLEFKRRCCQYFPRKDNMDQKKEGSVEEVRRVGLQVRSNQYFLVASPSNHTCREMASCGRL